MPNRRAPGVLVVDDQANMRALLQTVLRYHGFNVWLAPGGPEAVELYRDNRERIAVVLLNVALPEWDGPRTLHELQAVDPKAICCFVTGEHSGPTEAELLALGAAHVVRKPFEPADVARRLWDLVAASTGNRRSGARQAKLDMRVTVGEGLEPSEVVESWVSDLSPDGLRLQLPTRLGDVGAILSVRPVSAGDGVPWVPVQVRYARAGDDGWTVGCQFLTPAAGEALEFGTQVAG